MTDTVYVLTHSTKYGDVPSVHRNMRSVREHVVELVQKSIDQGNYDDDPEFKKKLKEKTMAWDLDEVHAMLKKFWDGAEGGEVFSWEEQYLLGRA